VGDDEGEREGDGEEDDEEDEEHGGGWLAGREIEDGGGEAAGLALAIEDLAKVLIGNAKHRGGRAVGPSGGIEVLAGALDGARQARWGG
jgi:hypothetical protein